MSNNKFRNFLKKLYRKYRESHSRRYRGMSVQEVSSSIYRENTWGGEKGTFYSGTGTVYQDFVQQNTYQEKVPCISLQKIFDNNNIAKADMLKVDCEGSKYTIIYETPKELWARMERIALEVHNLNNESRNMEHLQGYLAGFGFRFSSFKLENQCYMLFAEK